MRCKTWATTTIEMHQRPPRAWHARWLHVLRDMGCLREAAPPIWQGAHRTAHSVFLPPKKEFASMKLLRKKLHKWSPETKRQGSFKPAFRAVQARVGERHNAADSPNMATMCLVDRVNPSRTMGGRHAGQNCQNRVWLTERPILSGGAGGSDSSRSNALRCVCEHRSSC